MNYFPLSNLVFMLSAVLCVYLSALINCSHLVICFFSPPVLSFFFWFHAIIKWTQKNDVIICQI